MTVTPCFRSRALKKKSVVREYDLALFSKMDIPNFDFQFNFLDEIPDDVLANADEIPWEDAVRFMQMSDSEIHSMRQNSVNNNTAKTTLTWLNAYKSWAVERHVDTDIENIPPVELNLVLERFFAELRKNDGSEYEPESLAVMQASLDRHLKGKNYPTSIVRGREFSSSNATLKGKATQLRERGKGSRPNASKALTREEEDELWRDGKLGTSDPETLLHTVWHSLTQHLGFRGRQEHRTANLEDFHFGQDENNVEFIEYKDSKPTKTRPGGLRSKRRPQLPRMYATGTDRCPVSVFKKYISHRPDDFRNNGPLFLSTIPQPKSSVWYKNSRWAATE